MISFPFYKGHDSMDCGPTYLRMVATKGYDIIKFFVQSHSEAGGVQLLPMDGTAYYSSACIQRAGEQ
jgi:hypothetical protein